LEPKNKGKRLMPMPSYADLYQYLTSLSCVLPYRFSRSGRAFPPWHYFFEVTRRCNQRCDMCQYIHWLRAHSEKEQAAGELTTQEWFDVIDQTHRFSLISFTGGEPWVRDDFGQILTHACAKRRVHVITNGSLLTEKRAKRCVELAPRTMRGRGLVSLGVSLEGPPELHDEIVKLPGAFDRAATGVRHVNRYREDAGKFAPAVHVTSVIQAANVERLPEMPRICREIGVDVLNFASEIRLHDLPGIGETDPCEYEESDVVNPQIPRATLRKALILTKAAAEEEGVTLRLPRMPEKQLLAHYGAGLDLDEFICRLPWRSMFVGRQGGVYPCLIHKVGDVRRQTLSQAWRSPAMRAFRRHLQGGPFPVCQGCCELEYRGPRPARAAAASCECGRRGAS
jgi:MoaA/NifB/PqqE/SkfB family radical SAM enzyme